MSENMGSETKNRHGCLTAWLIIMMIANAGTALLYLVQGQEIMSQFPGSPGWAAPVLILLGIANLIFAIALFFWKKWGFFGFLGSSVVALIVNLVIGIGIGQALPGLIGIALLYGVLQIGDENKGWPQLE